MDAENKLAITRWEWVRGLGGKGEGIEKHKLLVMKTEDVQTSTGKRADNTVLTVSGARWAPDSPEGSLCTAHKWLKTTLRTQNRYSIPCQL